MLGRSSSDMRLFDLEAASCAGQSKGRVEQRQGRHEQVEI